MQTPSIPTTPVSPRSPLMSHRSPFESPSTSPGPFRRSTSPRRNMMDVGFASAVANICEQAHEIVEQERRKHKGEGTFHFFIYFSTPSPLILSVSICPLCCATITWAEQKNMCVSNKHSKKI